MDQNIEQPKMIATEQEMKDARIPIAWRDYCAHILIKLNKCRNENFYLVNKCVDLRHAYEKCQYDDYKRRQKLYAIREAEKESSSS